MRNGRRNKIMCNNNAFQLDEFSSRCDILTEAVSRYYKRTFPRRKGAASVATGEHPWLGIFRAKDAGFVGLVNHLDVIMKNKRGCQDEMPKMDMDEHCKNTVVS